MFFSNIKMNQNPISYALLSITPDLHWYNFCICISASEFPKHRLVPALCWL